MVFQIPEEEQKKLENVLKEKLKLFPDSFTEQLEKVPPEKRMEVLFEKMLLYAADIIAEMMITYYFKEKRGKDDKLTKNRRRR